MAAYRAVRFTETCVVQDARAGTPDETRYDKDSVHVLPERSAQHWRKRGYADYVEDDDLPQQAEAPKPDPVPSTQSEAPEMDDESMDEMTVDDAIAELDPDDPSHWTASGKPAVDALSAILGRPVTAAERDAAID